MRERRRGRTILIVIASVALVGTSAFLSQIFAQEDMPPDMPPEMMEDDMFMDDMGMMGPGVGAPSPGVGLAWTEQEMPEELTMTYEEFLARTGMPRAAIPDNFLFDKDGNPRRNTENQWRQLQRIYADRALVAVDVARAGTPGFGLATRIQRQMAIKEAEIADVNYLYEKGLESFSFDIRYPQFDDSAITPGATSVPIRVGVIMKVKPGVDQRYPSLVYRKLKKYDFYGTDRQIFRIHDYEGGMWNPKQIHLYNGAVSAWNNLWQQNSIQLSLYDATGRQIVSSTQSAGHTGGILAKLLYPDTLNYAPMHETIMGGQDKRFTGGNLNLPGTKGWYYDFTFNIPLADLSGLDRAEAVLVGAGGVQGSRGQTSAPPPGTGDYGASRAAVQAGADRATDVARRGVGMAGYSMGPGFY